MTAQRETLLLVALALLIPACAPSDPVAVQVSAIQRDDVGVSAGLSVLGPDGEATRDRNRQITVQTAGTDGVFESARNVSTRNSGPVLLDIMVVADNSGSQRDHLAPMLEAIRNFARVVHAGSPEHRLGLTRVSTQSRVVQPLTSDPEVFDAALGELFITNGWSALWDGIRLANGALAEASSHADGTSVCAGGRYRAVVVFTDGRDNNSSNERPTRYEDDGIHTTLDDVLNQRIAGVRTPIHTIGIGDAIDEEALSRIATTSGAQYRWAAQMANLYGVLRSSAAQLGNVQPICFEPADCSDTRARVSVTSGRDTVTTEFEFPASCPR